MLSKLNQLKAMTTVVADTGDIAAIRSYKPQDATTNPSLILKAAQVPDYQHLIEEAIRFAPPTKDISLTLDKVAVNVGCEILKIIPGRVSTEVDARLSFDVEATYARAKRLIDLYQQQGVDKKRILIKIAATWEGIEACRQLQREGITCNMTLMFNFAQAVACADAGATLISPFVGRIYDWYKKQNARDYLPEEDPGVLSVKRIYEYFRHFDIPTIVMGASFRSTGQLEALSGCDYLTISPDLLAKLQSDSGVLEQALTIEDSKRQALEKFPMNQKIFRWLMNEDAMATEKLAEGIRGFAKDTVALQDLLYRM